MLPITKHKAKLMLKELLRAEAGVKRIVFVRHGRDIGSDIRELSDFGKKQASRTADFLKDVEFDSLYSSDLLRTQQTFGFITQFHSLEKKLNRGLRAS